MQVNENPNKVPVELNRTSLYLGLLSVFVLGLVWIKCPEYKVVYPPAPTP